MSLDDSSLISIGIMSKQAGGYDDLMLAFFWEEDITFSDGGVATGLRGYSKGGDDGKT